MTTSEADPDSSEEGQRFHVHLPGFIAEEEVGLGDVIKRATFAVGIKPCGGCERRAALLNRWVAFQGRNQPHRK